MAANINSLTEGINGSAVEFLSFYLPADTFRKMYPDNTIRKLFFNVDEAFQPQAEEMLKDYRSSEDKGLSFTSKSTLKEHYREQTRANTVTGLVISLIIALVGILNFVNSMATAIISRRREFAMIQSIGMTKGQLRNMLIYEGLYYAGITLAASYLLGALAVEFGVRMMVSGDWTATFRFTLMPLVICTPVLLLLAVLIPYLCLESENRALGTLEAEIIKKNGKRLHNGSLPRFLNYPPNNTFKSMTQPSNKFTSGFSSSRSGPHSNSVSDISLPFCCPVPIQYSFTGLSVELNLYTCHPSETAESISMIKSGAPCSRYVQLAWGVADTEIFRSTIVSNT